MINVEAVLLAARLVFYVIGFAVTVIAIGTAVDHLAGLLLGDTE